jgi:hypothetical protein
MRTRIEMDNKSAFIDFLATHIAHISVACATQCDHNWRAGLNEDNKSKVMMTSVLEPRARDKIAVTMTHGNPGFFALFLELGHCLCTNVVSIAQWRKLLNMNIR